MSTELDQYMVIRVRTDCARVFAPSEEQAREFADNLYEWQWSEDDCEEEAIKLDAHDNLTRRPGISTRSLEMSEQTNMCKLELTENQILDLELVIGKLHPTFKDEQLLHESMADIEKVLAAARNAKS